ncbi:MAG: 50S ribosomal protein L24 [Candidatus Colwellbacteria bacterium CG10_big_fil_rev_8_21_14_0_10_41_28]|uniref:Large ribosomal subunit protein uL24 n=1 Tax=Candidatus Colwellbacteria bacterium CG10_big_fil_rev_8_21_14_0_10_41_28 TaxID=1974539 RepID=A0A2H0VH69_9BACT|nr:MAG: 50S ribosomal protein L24 [Candidatus Colwellbacteria bacterium CG10_big_fil_rev_8_21_14_0_10_41_28]
MKVKKGDKVQMLSGKDRGKAGKIIKVFPKEGRVVVEDLNLIKKTVRPKKQGEKGQIVSIPSAVRIDNVGFVCPKCSKPTRLGNKTDGKVKERYCKKCKATV